MPRVTETIANLTKKITDHLEQKADKEEKYPSLLVVEEFDVRMLGRIRTGCFWRRCKSDIHPTKSPIWQLGACS